MDSFMNFGNIDFGFSKGLKYTHPFQNRKMSFDTAQPT